MTTKKFREQKGHQSHVMLYLFFVLLTSFFTYFFRYNYPPYPFWDEPYHIAAAQKYINGVFFMEPHPPLGKLLIALGEKITASNSEEKNRQFITTDYATELGDGFSFTGYRLFPSLLGWLAAPLLFFIFLFFTGNPAISSLFSFLYIFDNAQIVHSRGAMVDTPVTFFGLLLILSLLWLTKVSPRELWKFATLSLLAGLSFGLIMTTKLIGLIFILLFPAVLWKLFPDWRRITFFVIFSFIGFASSYYTVWQIHFTLATKIQPELSEQGYYQASDAYKDILSTNRTSDFRSFPIMLRDSMNYVSHYQRGVPRLDLCKPDENGSFPLFWPVGARTINYRWEKADTGVRYLYLQSNPVTWACGFLGVLLSAFFLLTRILLPGSPKLKHGFYMLVFLGIYVSYMLAISRLDRVMYLYHYFIPLTISYILFGLCIENIQNFGKIVIDHSKRLLFMTALSLVMFGGYQYYRALTYYEPISNEAFVRRAILPLWELTCVGCDKVSRLVVPVHRD